MILINKIAMEKLRMKFNIVNKLVKMGKIIIRVAIYVFFYIQLISYLKYFLEIGKYGCLEIIMITSVIIANISFFMYIKTFRILKPFGLLIPLKYIENLSLNL